MKRSFWNRIASWPERSGIRGFIQGVVDSFWLWLYKEARRHLPKDYHDEVWANWLKDKVEALRLQAGDDFVLWLTQDEPEPPGQAREFRDRIREIRDLVR